MKMLLNIYISILITMSYNINAYTLYMDTKGSDSNSGTKNRPLKTFSGIQKRLTYLWNSRGPENSIIKINKGVYYRDSIGYWDLYDSRFSITFEGIKEEYRDKTIFDGQRQQKYFGIFNFSGRSNITLRNFTIKNYNEAVTFRSSKNSLLSSVYKKNSHNKIENISFMNIGNYYYDGPSNHPSYAVVRLLASHFNTITSNLFINNHNNYQPRLLHSIYSAHWASNNIISYNRFSNFSGRPIKFRDYSNNNIVKQNYFSNTRDSNKDGVIDKFQLESVAIKLLDGRKECPSEGIFVSGNFIGRNLKPKNIVEMNFNIGEYPLCPLSSNFFSKVNSYSVKNNQNIKNGLCLIKSKNKCNGFGLKKGSFIHDSSIKWSNSHHNYRLCKRRASHFYNSCTKKGSTKQNIIISQHHDFNKEKISRSEFGHGCYITSDNCPRMNLNENERTLDFLNSSHSSKKRCLNRLRAWYGSCSKHTTNEKRYVKAEFFNGFEKEEVSMGNGCYVVADYCPRMKLKPGVPRLDFTNNSSHQNAQSCLNRKNAWSGSCSRNLGPNQKAGVKMIYFKNGTKVTESVN